MADWQPAETAPHDRQILARNNRGNYAVVIWQDNDGKRTIHPSGWVVVFSDAVPHPFWNGANGSVMTHWAEITPPAA